MVVWTNWIKLVLLCLYIRIWRISVWVVVVVVVLTAITTTVTITPLLIIVAVAIVQRWWWWWVSKIVIFVYLHQVAVLDLLHPVVTITTIVIVVVVVVVMSTLQIDSEKREVKLLKVISYVSVEHKQCIILLPPLLEVEVEVETRWVLLAQRHHHHPQGHSLHFLVHGPSRHGTRNG